MAAVLPIIAGKAAGDKDKIKAALSNDIAVLRGTTKPRGKGKKKHGGGVEYEVHVNPTSLATGAAVAGGAVLVGAGALWLSGMSVGRQDGASDAYTIRPVSGKTGTWRVYTKRGAVFKTITKTGTEVPTESDVLSANQIARGWVVDDFKKVGDVYYAKLKNDRKRQFTIGKRPRFTIFGSSTGEGGVSLWDVLTTPGKDWKW